MLNISTAKLMLESVNPSAVYDVKAPESSVPNAIPTISEKTASLEKLKV